MICHALPVGPASVFRSTIRPINTAMTTTTTKETKKTTTMTSVWGIVGGNGDCKQIVSATAVVVVVVSPSTPTSGPRDEWNKKSRGGGRIYPGYPASFGKTAIIARPPPHVPRVYTHTLPPPGGGGIAPDLAPLSRRAERKNHATGCCEPRALFIQVSWPGVKWPRSGTVTATLVGRRFARHKQCPHTRTRTFPETAAGVLMDNVPPLQSAVRRRRTTTDGLFPL